MIKLLVAIVCCVVAATPVIRADTKYTSKYDGINIEAILKNDRLVNMYFQCIMDTGMCTPEGDLLKKILPEAMENGCAKCSEIQKVGTDKVFKFLMKNKNDLWKQIVAKYDPQDIYSRRYSEKSKDANV